MTSRATRGRAVIVALTMTLLAWCGPSAPPRAPQPPARAPSAGTTVVGVASWYGPGFHGKRTASGERFDQDDLTAAHGTWPFGTRAKVTLLSTGRSVVVRINDRLPRRDRVIDLSRGAARAIGLIGPGRGRVRLEIVD